MKTRHTSFDEHINVQSKFLNHLEFRRQSNVDVNRSIIGKLFGLSRSAKYPSIKVIGWKNAVPNRNNIHRYNPNYWHVVLFQILFTKHTNEMGDGVGERLKRIFARSCDESGFPSMIYLIGSSETLEENEEVYANYPDHTDTITRVDLTGSAPTIIISGPLKTNVFGLVPNIKRSFRIFDLRGDRMECGESQNCVYNMERVKFRWLIFLNIINHYCML